MSLREPTPAGRRGPGRNQSSQGTRGGFLGERQHQTRKKWGLGGGLRGEQRVTLAVVDAKGAPGRLKEGCGDVEKAGQG